MYEPGLAQLLMRLAAAGLTNVFLLRGDAVALLRERVPPASLAGIRIFFPDPWPKRRHHKRRLVQPDFVALAASRLEPGGILHLATDWGDYARQMRAVCDAEPRSRTRPRTSRADGRRAPTGGRSRSSSSGRASRAGRCVT